VFRYTARGFGLVWRTHRGLTLLLGTLSVAAGLLPAAVAYVGKPIVAAVLRAGQSQAHEDGRSALLLVAAERGWVALLRAAERGIAVGQNLLGVVLGQGVNELSREKALSLSLSDFDVGECDVRMTRARREASSRPLSLVRRAFGVLENAVSLSAYA